MYRTSFLVDKIVYGLLLTQEEGMGPLIIMRDQLRNIQTTIVVIESIFLNAFLFYRAERELAEKPSKLGLD